MPRNRPAGDAQVFKAIVAVYRVPLYRLALSILNDADEAADAMMDLPAPTNNTFFGSSVALQDDLLLVGSRFSSAVFVYQGQRASWTDQLKVIIDQGPGEFEAWPVAIDGDTVVRGSPGEFGNSAHVFEIFTR